MNDLSQNNIRNFAIIAHVDHGKSTLADRLLEITGTVQKDKLREQFLDQNPISRERGITIKLAPVRMEYHFQKTQNTQPTRVSDNQNFRQSDEYGLSDSQSFPSLPKKYILNLIDTPGHVDFSYEVSRTLAAIEGAILLVDATQGIQAQTVAHYQAAKKENLIFIPVINKIDLPNAQKDVVTKELVDYFGFDKEEILYISAKSGENVGLLLEAIIKRFPAPKGQEEKPLRALIFDAVYDEYRGVIAYVRIIDGNVGKGDKIQLTQSGVTTEITELGYFSPFLMPSQRLSTGEIGYIITGIKDIRQSRVGDTIFSAKFKVQNAKLITDSGEVIDPLPGYQTPKPMIFFGVYPKNPNDLVHLRESLAKLTLNDTALSYTQEYSAYLGSGYRVGFLGLLHSEIVKERLLKEFDLELLFTMPQVLYERKSDESMLEPYMKLIVFVPNEYVGGVISVCQKRKGNLLDLVYHDAHAVLTYEMPYSMFVRGLSGELKSISSGFASIDYKLIEYRPADLVQLEIRINDNPIDVLSELVYKDEAIHIARQKAEKLKESLDRAQFRQVIQALLNGTIVAREEIPPFRKDVLQKMSGGDRSRKDKLLEAQKKGKKRILSTAKVALSQEALFSMIDTFT